jgi:PAS domain S-box-containing protein
MPRPVPFLAAGAALGAVVATAVWGVLFHVGASLTAALLAGAGAGLLAAVTLLAIRRPPTRQARHGKSWLQNIPLAIVSPDGRWQRVSRRLAAMLRTSRRQLRGQSMFDDVHPHYREAVAAWLREGNADDADIRVVLLVKRHDQAAPSRGIYVRLRAWARRDATGGLLAWRCSLTNATRELRAQRALRAGAAATAQVRDRLRHVEDDFDRLKISYRDLYHNAPVMYFSLDAEGRLVTFNDTLIRTLGYERSTLQGCRYSDLLAEPNHGTPVIFSQPHEREEEWETQWRRQDGGVIDVLLHTVAIFDAQGRFVRWRSSALDFTERTRLTQELRDRHDEVERANARLRLINSELEDFTYVVSHDLKQPLRTLQAYSRLLAQEFASQLGPDGFQYINHLLQASQRLGNLIDDLLALSQAGRATRAPKAFNLIEAVATVRRDLVDLIQRKEAVVLTEGSLPQVVGDPARITQLLSNLVANGLKYNQSAAPQVVIGQAEDQNEPGQAVIYVRDNGIGIEAQHHQRIFGLFRRLHEGDQYEGTGAGLAICKKIVEAHGGRIWVKSQPSHGSTFVFTLPKPGPTPAPARRADSFRAPNGPPSASTILAGSSPPPGAPTPVPTPRLPMDGGTASAAETVHVLLVEDMADVAAVIQKLGRRSGLRVTWYDTAEKAWDYLQDHQPDFMLLDINLPGMNGIELCRRIRTVLRSKTPIAMFSQEQRPDEIARLREMGADYFLSKDLLSRPDLWQKKLAELIARSRTLA